MYLKELTEGMSVRGRDMKGREYTAKVLRINGETADAERVDRVEGCGGAYDEKQAWKLRKDSNGFWTNNYGGTLLVLSSETLPKDAAVSVDFTKDVESQASFKEGDILLGREVAGRNPYAITTIGVKVRILEVLSGNSIIVSRMDGTGRFNVNKVYFTKIASATKTETKVSGRLELRKGMRVQGKDMEGRSFYGRVYSVASDGNSATIKRSDGLSGGGQGIPTYPYLGKSGWIILRKSATEFHSDYSHGTLTIVRNHHKLPTSLRKLSVY